MNTNRRSFLKTGFLLGAGVAGNRLAGVANAASPAATPRTVSLPMLKTARAGDSRDVLIRMQQELVQALAKPVEQRRWGMIIDTRKCVGCHACTVGCVLENKLPPGVVYRPVVEAEVGTYPNVKRRFLPRPCMQCESPPCVPVCPVNATWKRADGIVEIDYNACIGCRYCITACPYQARTFDFGQDWTDHAAQGADGALALTSGRAYEEQASHEYGRDWHRADGIFPKSPVGNARKCTFCLHRLEHGQLPMCVTTCIGRATLFGDLNDANSLVAEAAVANNVVRLKEELGTGPQVYYLV